MVCPAEQLAVLFWDIQEKTAEEALKVLQALVPGELADAMDCIAGGHWSTVDWGEGMGGLTTEHPSVYCSLPVPYCSCPTFQRTLRSRGSEGPAAVCAHLIALTLLRCARASPGPMDGPG